MTKHTRGPWLRWKDKNRCINLGPSINHTVAIVMHTPGDDASEANADLLAAAPDLLEALEAIVESGEIPYCYSSPLVIQAKAAIAKAKGEPK